MANQYVGIKSALNLNGKHHLFKTDVEAYYDFFPPSIEASPLLKHQYGAKAGMEYRYKTKSLDLYGRGRGYLMLNPKPGFYHPEIAAISLGMDFRSKPAQGKLSLNGNLFTEAILHEDPDSVSFNETKLVYGLQGSTDPVLDFRAGFQLQARVSSFALIWDLSTPLKADRDLQYYLYEGIYTSSDFTYGNTFFTSLSIEWYWWK
jgi:hypothetical protein